MEAKEKAKELVEFFKDFVHGYVGSSFMTGYEYPESILLKAKKCSLRCVNEIINSNPTDYWEEIKENVGYVQNRECSEYYWQEVKQEIEKL